MEEESLALDGHASFLCISALSRGICSKLSEHFKKDNTPKPPSGAGTAKSETQASSNGTAAPSTVQDEGHGAGEVGLPVPPPAPHPSDLATPASPHDPTSTVDELRSSLRQVADALAQTVAAVRSTRQQMMARPEGEAGAGTGSTSSTGPGGEGGGERGESMPSGESEVPMETSDSGAVVPTNPRHESLFASALAESQHSLLPSLSPVTLPPPPPPPTSNPALLSEITPLLPVPLLPLSAAATATPAPTSSASPVPHPILATFDGSQESARATLATTDPEDPLYTFFHAVAGAPAPPAPTTSSSSPSLSSAPAVHEGTTSPRLPVFAQFQSGASSGQSPSSALTTPPSHVQSSSSAIHIPVIQDSRNLQSSGGTATRTASATSSSTLGILPSVDSTTPSTTALGPTTTQVTSHPSQVVQSTPPAPAHSQPLSSTAPGAPSLADTLASQVSSFFTQNTAVADPPPVSLTETAPALGGATLVQVANLADTLAQQLVHTVTSLAPPTTAQSTAQSGSPSEGHASSGVSVSSPLPHASAGELAAASTAPLSATGRATSTQSPSPSDTLAPLLLQSLQMQSSTSGDGLDSAPSGVAVAVPTTSENQPGLVGDQLQGGELPATGSLEQAEAMGVHAGSGGDTWSTLATGSQGGTHLPSTSGTATPSASTVWSQEPLAQAEGRTSSAVAGEPVRMEIGASGQQTGATSSSSTEGAGGVEPTEIDPTFLAALPESIRHEVIVQHEREQLAQRVQREAFQSSISSDFLSALPPNIQEEVRS